MTAGRLPARVEALERASPAGGGNLPVFWLKPHGCPDELARTKADIAEAKARGLDPLVVQFVGPGDARV